MNRNDMAHTQTFHQKKSPMSVAEDPRWARILTRDKTADGHLWYSVVTTGVYCRPSCPSRAANPKNVQLHDSLEGAKATGFRPCKRCNPDGLSADAENMALVAKESRNNEEITVAVGQTSPAAIFVASTNKGVSAILLGDDPDELVRDLQDRFPKAHLIGADCEYEALVARGVGFFRPPR